MENKNKRRVVRDWSGTAGHLYFLVTGDHHPKCECSVCQILNHADEAYESKRDEALVEI